MLKSLVVLIFLLSNTSKAGDLFQNKYILEINKSLKSITSQTVKFRQTYKEKEEVGEIYYKKNKGLFVKYKTSPVTILVNQNSVTYYDSKLNQKSQIPTKDSASEIFINPLQINSNNFDLQSVEDLGEAIKITAIPRKRKDEGIFIMYFSKKDNILRRVDVKQFEEDSLVRVDLHSHHYKSISNERFKATNINKYKI